MKTDVIRTEKGQIEYSIAGCGKTIIFLHGGHSNCKESLFHKGIDTKKYQLLIPSRPGYGRTPLSDFVTPEKTAELIISLLDTLRIDKAIIYGISAGGLPAIACASNFPERVDKLILASAVTKKWLQKEDKDYRLAQLLFRPKIGVYTWWTIKLFARILPNIIAKSFHSNLSSAKLQKLVRKDVQTFISEINEYNSGNGFICDIEHDIEDDLISNIQCPTLILHSKNDKSVSINHAIHAAKMIKNSRLVTFQNDWGHLFPIGNDTSKVHDEILDFLES